jgi:hypothetical protein
MINVLYHIRKAYSDHQMSALNFCVLVHSSESVYFKRVAKMSYTPAYFWIPQYLDHPVNWIVWHLLQGIIIFALVMGTLGFQVPVESGHQLITQVHHLWLTFSITPNINSHLVDNTKQCAMTRQEHMKISSVLHCSREALPHTILLNVQERDREAYAQDHFLGVITNSIGLAIQYIWQGRWTELVSYCHTGEHNCNTIIWTLWII